MYSRQTQKGMAERREIRDPEIDDDEEEDTGAGPAPAAGPNAGKSEENMTAATSKESLNSRAASQDAQVN